MSTQDDKKNYFYSGPSQANSFVVYDGFFDNMHGTACISIVHLFITSFQDLERSKINTFLDLL